MHPIYTETPIIITIGLCRINFFGVKIVKHHAYCTLTLHNKSELHNDYQTLLLKLLIK